LSYIIFFAKLFIIYFSGQRVEWCSHEVFFFIQSRRTIQKVTILFFSKVMIVKD
jgi:hypothetical protein